MNIRSSFLVFFTFVLLFSGCKKKDLVIDPCDGLISETPPTKIIVKFVDKETGENLIFSQSLKASDISVINASTGKSFVNWAVVTEVTNSPLNGVLQFSVFHETAGEYPYQIKLAEFGMIKLAYTVSKTATSNPCRPTAYPISDIKIVDHEFKHFTYDGKSYPNILVVEL